MSRVLDPQIDRTSMSRALGPHFSTIKLPNWNATPATRGTRLPGDEADELAVQTGTETTMIPTLTNTPLADVIVIDASVLIYALGAVQRWCHDGQTQVVIPLEALNTLDVLKSGTNQTAVRSRAASRVLEEEVGNNPRIRVQRDDAFVPWDSIAAKSATGGNSIPNQPDSRWKVEGAGAPEWMKRMVCCAKWEASAGNPDGKRVVFAVVDAKDVAASAGRHDNLVDGELVSEWSTKLGLEVVKVDKEKPTGSPTKGERRTRGGGKPTPAITAPPAGKVIRVLARGEKLEPE
ncbi:PIN domain [Rhizoctonia solani]|uniref:PIN domain n=1 Tax=Rhizoctonia solani TaxID=456999 RepID=A0A8H7IA51_9AGAM|nr:PIN domain [Rhizoctonia solani]